MHEARVRHGFILEAIVGGLVWSIVWLVLPDGADNFLSQSELLMFFGVAVIVPLGLLLSVQPDRHGVVPPVLKWIFWFQPISVIGAGLAMLQPDGLMAALLAGAWLVQGFLIAVYGLTRLLSRSVIAVEEISIDAGLIYAPISGIWLIAYCAGFPLLTFDPVFVLLTAVHFVFITLGALVITGMIGRRLLTTSRWNMYRVVAWSAIVSPLLVAIGISTTQFTGILFVEALSVLMLAISFILLVLLCLVQALPAQIFPRMLLLLSGGALLVTMGFALAYSIGRLTGWWFVSIPLMVEWHGWINAIGFVFISLLAWAVTTPVAQVQRPGIPFSRLPLRWTIRPDFFMRINALNRNPNPIPTGIADRLMDYQRAGFDPSLIAPEIVAFYEHTDSHSLLVYPEWQTGFRTLAALYKRVSSRIGQMNFPLQPDSRESAIMSKIVSIHDVLDGRSSVRGWIRVYAETQEAVYVAAYATHNFQGETFMNIAFPLPFGNLTSILRLEHMTGNSEGLSLTSYSTRNGDQGVYFATRLISIRLPINEIIEVYPSGNIYDSYPNGFAQGAVVARHKMWLFGRHCLTLHYSIDPISLKPQD